MLSAHCGKRVRQVEDTRFRFVVQCQVCGKTFTQRKRQKGEPEHSVVESESTPVRVLVAYADGTWIVDTIQVPYTEEVRRGWFLRWVKEKNEQRREGPRGRIVTVTPYGGPEPLR